LPGLITAYCDNRQRYIPSSICRDLQY